MKNVIVSLFLLQATLASDAIELYKNARKEMSSEKATYYDLERQARHQTNKVVDRIQEDIIILSMFAFMVFVNFYGPFSYYKNLALTPLVLLALFEAYVKYYQASNAGHSIASSLVTGCLSGGKVLVTQPLGGGLFMVFSLASLMSDIRFYLHDTRKIKSALKADKGLDDVSSLSELLVDVQAYLQGNKEAFKKRVKSSLPEYASNPDLVALKITDLLSHGMVIDDQKIVTNTEKLFDMVKALIVESPRSGEMWTFFEEVFEREFVWKAYRKRVTQRYDRDFRNLDNYFDKYKVLDWVYQRVLRTRYPGQIISDPFRGAANIFDVFSEEIFEDHVDLNIKTVINKWDREEEKLDAANRPRVVNGQPMDVLRKLGVKFIHPISLDEITQKSELKSALETQSPDSHVDEENIDRDLKAFAGLMKHHPQGDFALRPSALRRKAPLYTYPIMEQGEAKRKGVKVYRKYAPKVSYLGNMTIHQVETTPSDRLIFMMASIYSPTTPGKIGNEKANVDDQYPPHERLGQRWFREIQAKFNWTLKSLEERRDDDDLKNFFKEIVQAGAFCPDDRFKAVDSQFKIYCPEKVSEINQKLYGTNVTVEKKVTEVIDNYKKKIFADFLNRRINTSPEEIVREGNTYFNGTWNKYGIILGQHPEPTLYGAMVIPLKAENILALIKRKGLTREIMKSVMPYIHGQYTGVLQGLLDEDEEIVTALLAKMGLTVSLVGNGEEESETTLE